jgi:hypothetical protein
VKCCGFFVSSFFEAKQRRAKSPPEFISHQTSKIDYKRNPTWARGGGGSTRRGQGDRSAHHVVRGLQSTR